MNRLYLVNDNKQYCKNYDCFKICFRKSLAIGLTNTYSVSPTIILGGAPPPPNGTPAPLEGQVNLI